MTDTAAGDDKKLFPESERPEDEQVLWLAFVVVAILGLLLFGLSQCGSASDLADEFTLGGDDGAAATSITTSLEDDRDLETSASFFALSDYDRDLGDSDAGPFTVFAPSNDAWDAAAGEGDDRNDVVDSFDGDSATGAAELHIVEGEFTLDELRDAGTVTTISGLVLNFGDDDLINGAVSVEEADIEAENGLVHRIDGIFAAGAAAPDPEPTAAPEPTPEVEEEAAAPAPTAAPTAAPEPTAVPAPPAPAAAFTIADLAGDTADLSTLTGLVGTLGLDAALADPDAGPFTVFAPTDAAFENAGAVLSQLTDAEVESTVTYHVVPGIVPASEVVPGASFETLNGQTFVIASDGTLPGGVNVVTADQETDNGLVHIIDGVLVPPPVVLRLLNAEVALEGIQFDVSSAVIRPESEAILNRAAAVLSSLPEGVLVEVAGHTDSDGGAEGNQILSDARANSVLNYLVNQGVNADVLTAMGYGESDLKIDPETSAADKQVNRRIEFVPQG